MTFEDYYHYLLTRGRAAQLYRRLYLYPRLCAHLHGRVLDFGCGIGDFLRYRPNTVGVDINPFLVDHCRSQGFEAFLSGGPPMAFPDGSFDGVVMDNVLEHLSQPAALIADIRRLLTPPGKFIVGVPGSRGFAADPDHKRFYDEARLRAELFSHGFGCRSVFHTPFRSTRLERRIRQYAVYGVFEKFDE
jgi:SAM-dependent methyltransferase